MERTDISPTFKQLLEQTFESLDHKVWLAAHRDLNTGSLTLMIDAEPDANGLLFNNVEVKLDNIHRKIRVFATIAFELDVSSRACVAKIGVDSFDIGYDFEIEHVMKLCKELIAIPARPEPRGVPSGGKGPQGMSGKHGDTFRAYLNYITDKDHVWDKSRYGKKNMNGTAFDLEANLQFIYCMGNAHLEGMIGDSKVEIFFNYLQGFQIHLAPWPLASRGDAIRGDAIRALNFTPDNADGVFEALRQLFNPSY